MMKKKTVLNRLSAIKGELADYGVSHIGLFGSTVRDENTRSSDIDILIDFFEGKENYRNYLSVCELLQTTLGKQKLDVVTYKGLSPYIGDFILNEVVYV